MKIVILGASVSSNNLGVCALASGSVKAIKHCFPNANIYIMDYAYQPEELKLFIEGDYINVKLVNIRYSKKIYLKNNIAALILLAIIIRLIPNKWVKDRIYNNNPYIKLLSDANIVFSVSGGDSFSDIYGLGRFLYVSLPQLLCVFMKKDIFQMPQTYGPFNNKSVRFAARYILKNSKYIYSRDYFGENEIISIIGKKKIEQRVGFCYDMGFILDPDPPKELCIDGNLKDYNNLVGFNVSGLLYIGGYTRNNMFDLKIDYKIFTETLIEHLIIDKKRNVILVPHVLGNKENVESDWIACDRIYNNLKDRYPNKLYFAKGKYNHNEIKYIIAKTELFIGSRMHACIAALSQNIPAVAIAYSDKFTGVMKSIGMEKLVADPRELDGAGLLTKIDMALENREVFRNILSEKMPHVKKNIYNVFRQVSCVSKTAIK